MPKCYFFSIITVKEENARKTNYKLVRDFFSLLFNETKNKVEQNKKNYKFAL